MTVRNLLLRAYPRTWRDEYGEELAGVLAQRRLTFAVVADVLANGARQHLYRDDPWKICGTGLLMWTSTVVLFAAARLFTYPSFLWCYMAGFLFLFAAGAWTMLRQKSGVWRATVASAKAALIGHSPDVAMYAAMFRGGAHSWMLAKTFAITLLLSLLFGLAGAVLGRFITALRRGLRAA